MTLEAKWYRFRLLNAGPSRSLLVKLKNYTGEDVGPEACYVIATDEGEWWGEGGEAAQPLALFRLCRSTHMLHHQLHLDTTRRQGGSSAPLNTACTTAPIKPRCS
jgi:hypothetical protein